MLSEASALVVPRGEGGNRIAIDRLPLKAGLEKMAFGFVEVFGCELRQLYCCR